MRISELIGAAPGQRERRLAETFLRRFGDREGAGLFSGPGRPKYQQWLIKFMQKTQIGANLDTRKLMARIERILLKYPYDDAKYMVSLFGAYMTKEIVDKRLLGEGEMYTFETLKLRGPARSDEFLTHFFGDYMTPPPDKDKDKHNIQSIEFERKNA